MMFVSKGSFAFFQSQPLDRCFKVLHDVFLDFITTIIYVGFKFDLHPAFQLPKAGGRATPRGHLPARAKNWACRASCESSTTFCKSR